MRTYRTLFSLTLASTLAVSSLPAVFATEGQEAPRAAVREETDRFVVTFAEDAPTQEREKAIDELESAQKLANTSIVKESLASDSRSTVFEADSMLSPEQQQEVVDKLKQNPLVKSVEPDRIVHALASTGEPFYSRQWALGSSYLNVAPAWQKYNGAGQTIGIVDTGYSVHPDFDNQHMYGYDFITSPEIAQDNDGRDPSPFDQGSQNAMVNWHGTFVAGIAAARANGVGTTGVAPAAGVTHARALGLGGDGYVSDIAEALVWASGGHVDGVPANQHPATVVNMSLSYPAETCSTTMQSAINSALSRNVPVVVAAGNMSANANYHEPANCYRAIVVGAATSSFTLASYSNYGDMLDVVAPGGQVGGQIFGPLNSGFYRPDQPTYGNMSGTSMAAPYVSGTIALMKQAYPGIGVEQIRNILHSTGSNIAGYPSVNTAAAVQAAERLNPSPAVGLRGAIGAYYQATGGAQKYGMPLSNEFASINDGAIQIFEKNYSLYWTAQTGTHAVSFSGGIGARYRSFDYERGLGYPVYDEAAIPGGAMQKFALADGRINALYWTPQTSRTHRVWEGGAIGGRFTRDGGTNTYGFPVEDEVAIAHGYRQVYQYGAKHQRIYWAPNTGAYLVNGNGAIFWAWANRGGTLTDGFPVTDELKDQGDGVVQFFRKVDGGETGIWWSPATGAKALNSRGALYYHWLKNGYINRWGYPTTDETPHADGSVTVAFSSGVELKWNPATGVQRIR